ncbi:hypothetical protein ACGFYU_16630 [Streptomyces sp. NPDC048337]|uniref:hypothetical protein n=1 Tax=Streptomyces sp. NPDC048337 TaxID=3365535 RepID=UPI00371A59CE
MEPDSRNSPESRADALMDGLRADPERPAAIPSVSFPGGPRARGIADDESNAIAHLGMLRLYGGGPAAGGAR